LWQHHKIYPSPLSVSTVVVAAVAVVAKHLLSIIPDSAASGIRKLESFSPSSKLNNQ
jgi:hypothetical protein